MLPGTEHVCARHGNAEPSKKRREEVLGHWDAAQKQLNRVLFEEDPAGLVFEGALQKDEYELEAAAILPRLSSCKSATEVQELLHREIGRLIDQATAGPIESYARVSSRVWSEVVPILREGSIPCSTAL
jgi:hypothetical protein